jgi:hypothetical protein
MASFISGSFQLPHAGLYAPAMGNGNREIAARLIISLLTEKTIKEVTVVVKRKNDKAAKHASRRSFDQSQSRKLPPSNPNDAVLPEAAAKNLTFLRLINIFS